MSGVYALHDQKLTPPTSLIPPGVLFDVYAPIPTLTTTTYFWNYRCLHLTEMVKCRAKFTKRNQQEMNQITYDTLVKMLYFLGRLPTHRTFLFCTLDASHSRMTL